MKLLFLDIDGVLNSEATFKREHRLAFEGLFTMDARMVNRLKRIISETEAKIVLSSTWRRNILWPMALYGNGIDLNSVIGTTPITREGEIRGDKVNAFIKQTEDVITVEKYAILDDDLDFHSEQPLFKTSWKEGLTDEIADQVIAYLNE